MAVGFKGKYRAPVAVDTLTGTFVKSDVTKPICKVEDFCVDGINHVTRITLNAISRPITADASEAFGQRLFTLPETVFQVQGGMMRITMSTASGLSTTAGEIGLGAVVASGAVAVLSGSSTFQNILDGKTIASVSSGSSQTNTLLSAGGSTDGTNLPLDASASPPYYGFLNIASAWNQTAAESVTLSGLVVFGWTDLGRYS